MKPEALEGYVRIKSKRICHKYIYDMIGEIFGYSVKGSGKVMYGVSLNGKDYEFYEYELEPIDTNDRIDALKEKIVELELDLIRESIPHGHCCYCYYKPSIKHDDCGDISCGECKYRFMQDAEKDIREEVGRL